MFTKEEVQNLVVLVEAGARALAGQNKLDQASAILATADQLVKKVVKLAPEDPNGEENASE